MKFPLNIPIYGDMSFRNKNCSKEFYEQVSFVNHIRSKWPTVTHIENEGIRNKQQILKAKMSGLTTGASDIIIPGRITFVCEMKRIDHTLCSISDAQVNYLNRAKDDGAFVCIALGCIAALEALADWEKILHKEVYA